MSTLPLIRLSTATPIVTALDKRGVRTDAVLEGMGLTRAAFKDPETFVHATVMYQLCEEAAKATQDPHFMTQVGETIDTAGWKPLIKAGETAKTVGNFLTAFAIAATAHSSATQQCLEVRGQNAVFVGRRSFEPSIVPAQIDGFFVGLLITIVRRALGVNWKPAEVLIILSDPSVLPPVFHGIKAIRGDRKGYRIQFPAEWLNRPFDQPDFLRRATEEAADIAPARRTVAAAKQALKPYLGNTRLTVARAATICDLKPRSFSRLLAREGTTVSALIEEIKREAATEALAHSDRSVVDIAAALGYSDPTSFARSFKRWTGVSPREYRRSESS
jgi:AraC-like DNA-binding protein